MAMPTTRRGRYLLYRRRAMSRVGRAWRSRPYLDTPTGTRMHRSGCRQYVLFGYTKQVPITDYVVSSPFPRQFPIQPQVWLVKPERGVWGVFVHPPDEVPGKPWLHRRTAYHDHRKRRVLSIPRLKHLDRLPYQSPVVQDVVKKYYPFEYYPSGQLNPNWPAPPIPP